MAAGSRSGEIPLSEVVAGLSYALDITEGEPPGHAARTCAIGMRLAEEIGLDGADRSDLFYALLLKDAGCSANSARMAALFAVDDSAAKRTSKRVNWSRSYSAFVWTLRTIAPGGTLRARAGRLREIHDEGEVTRSLIRARCDRGAEIVRLIGLSPATAEAVRALDEHWDGHGQPHGLRGEEIPLLARILCLAQTVEIFHAARGVDAALRVAAHRRRGWFDPRLVDALGAIRGDRAFWAELDAMGRRATGRVGLGPEVAAWEPPDRLLAGDGAQLDRIATAFAGVVDAKSPWTYRHSDRTSLIAAGIAALLGEPQETLDALRRAAMLHDIGKLGVSNRILDKPARLTPAELAVIRRHPLMTADILGRVPGFGELAPVAAAHHERLDGRGYPHGLGAPELTRPMRVLAVADVYEALTSERPYRPAMDSDAALETMRRDVPARLDGAAFGALEAVLSETGPDLGAAARAANVLGQIV